MNESFNSPINNEKPKNNPISAPETGYNRRDFLKAMGALAVSAIIDRPHAQAAEEQGPDSSHVEKEVATLREELRSVYDVEVDFSPLFPKEAEKGMQSVPVEQTIEKKHICEAILNALHMYPPRMVKETQISIVRAVNDLKIDLNRSIAGILHKDEGVISVEFAHDPSLQNQTGKETGESLQTKIEKIKEIVHHEIEHQIELLDEISDKEYIDKTRTEIENGESYYPIVYGYLNELKAHLGNGLLKRVDVDLILEHDEGFARVYGRKDPQEDRATIVESLFGRNATQLYERAKTDLVLKKKIDFMKQYYFKQSYGVMDETYWRIAEVDDGIRAAQHISQRTFTLSNLDEQKFMTHIQDTLGEKANAIEIKKWQKSLKESTY
ncbi:MAG: hypothetical protein KBC35_00685 [Candidatus Pacebacteria bacterium]|nr:hypothetical protein [Candidatus Paceibacterota bacterium]